MAVFAFRSSWHVPHPPAAVRDVLIDVERYPEWWPQVLACLKLGPDDGVALCRSSLPYTLTLHLHAVAREPHRLETTISGDLEGWVHWLIARSGNGTQLTFEQEVTARGAALGLAAYVGRPALRWNHERMMDGARAGLAERLAR